MLSLPAFHLVLPGTTNLIKVHVVGHILVKGTSVNEKSVCAPLCVAETEEDLQKNYNPGDIIVMKETSNNIMEQLKTASAIVCEKDGKNSHAAIVGSVVMFRLSSEQRMRPRY